VAREAFIAQVLLFDSLSLSLSFIRSKGPVANGHLVIARFSMTGDSASLRPPAAGSAGGLLAQSLIMIKLWTACRPCGPVSPSPASAALRRARTVTRIA
jgi:hypothetical protein